MVTPAPIITPRSLVLNSFSSSMPERSTSKSGLANATPHVHEQIGPARNEAAAGMGTERRNRLFDGARLGKTEIGQRLRS